MQENLRKINPCVSTGALLASCLLGDSLLEHSCHKTILVLKYIYESSLGVQDAKTAKKGGQAGRTQEASLPEFSVHSQESCQESPLAPEQWACMCVSACLCVHSCWI